MHTCTQKLHTPSSIIITHAGHKHGRAIYIQGYTSGSVHHRIIGFPR